ncbi:adenosine deaminase-like protein [Lactifluus volemus]|nr:adenosine deaminase-like protein [Lactifluus volemus]
MTLSGFANPAEPALRALSPSQLAFLEALPKAELHAHLNGSIPLPFLEQLAREYTQSEPTSNGITPLAPEVLAGVRRLQTHEGLDCIYDFFELFPAIHALTSTPANLKRATRAILSHFLDPDPDPDAGTGRGTVAYIELRTTPRETAHMTRQAYLETVLDEIEARPPDVAALIVCLDRAMTPPVAREVIDLTVQLRRDGRRVVGVDLCGDPGCAGDMTMFVDLFRIARSEGLGVTLHIAETPQNSAAETKQLLSCEPHRLGHATHLDNESMELVLARRTCIEICLTSNVLCKTVQQLQDHPIRYYLERNHPITICTDDILPFRNSVLGEYALLMAPKPLGLGLTEGEIETVARTGMESRFPNTSR